MTPAEAIAAVRAAPPPPVVRALFVLRSLPALVTRRRGLGTERGVPLYDQLVEFGFVPLVDDEEELVLGYIGQPWRLFGGTMPRVEFRTFAEPGYVRATLSFHATPAEGGSVVETETRVKPTDAESRRAFARYWKLVRPGSAAIRRSWLRAAASRGSGPRPRTARAPRRG